MHVSDWWGKPADLDFTFFRLAEIEGYLRDAGFVVDETIDRQPYPDVERQSRRAYIFAHTPAHD